MANLLIVDPSKRIQIDASRDGTAHALISIRDELATMRAGQHRPRPRALAVAQGTLTAMLVYNTQKLIPDTVLAAMRHAEARGARTAAWSPTGNAYTDVDARMFVAEALDLHFDHGAIDGERTGTPFAIAIGPPSTTHVALTLAGFRRIKGTIWRWKADR